MSQDILQQAPVVLCHLLSPFSDRATVESLIQRLNQDEPLLDRVIELANRNFLIPTLYHQLNNYQLTTLVNADLLEYLQAMADFMKERNRQLTRQLSGIVKILNENGITPLIMKGGAVLFSDLYPDKGSRFMSDLDLLLPTAEVQRAKKLLEDNGYYTPEKHQPETEVNFYNHHHHIAPLYKDGEPSAIEIHLKPLLKKYQYFLSGEECFQHANRIDELSGQELDALYMSPEHQVLHCFVHSELVNRSHDYNILALRQLDYFVRLIHHYEETLDWDYISSKITTEYDQFAFNLYLYKANQLFGTTFRTTSNVSEKQKLNGKYKDSLNSCFPNEHYVWRTKRVLIELFGSLRKDLLENRYEINDTKDLWVARKKYISVLLKKYNNPSKILRRIIYGSQRLS